MYADEELKFLGFEPFRLGEPADAAILQTDHVEYRNLSRPDLPEIRSLFDGRSFLDRAIWSGIDFVALGSGSVF